MTVTAILLGLGLLLALAVILPVLTSEQAHKSLEEPGDADESSGPEDRDAAAPAPAPPRADQSSGSEGQDRMVPPPASPLQ